MRKVISLLVMTAMMFLFATSTSAFELSAFELIQIPEENVITTFSIVPNAADGWMELETSGRSSVLLGHPDTSETVRCYFNYSASLFALVEDGEFVDARNLDFYMYNFSLEDASVQGVNYSFMILSNGQGIQLRADYLVRGNQGSIFEGIYRRTWFL